MHVIGVDPGLTGAAAIVGPHGLIAVLDLPTMGIPGVGPEAKIKKKIDGRAFCSMLLAACPTADGKPTFVLEAVGTMGGKNNSVQSQGSLMRSLGALETVAECLNWPVAYVPTLTWKRTFGLIDSSLKDSQRKRLALETARRLYPQCDRIGRADDHNRAEAILLARWWYRHNVDSQPHQEAAEEPVQF